MKLAKIAVLSAILSGCTTTIDLRYQPQHAASYVPGAEKIALFVPPVEDASGGLKRVQNIGLFRPRFPRPMTEGVREALQTELKRDGFNVVSEAAQADGVLRATLTSARLWLTGNGGSIEGNAGLLVDLVLEGRVNRARVWAGGIEGSGSGKVGWDILLNQALANAMAQLGEDLAQPQLSFLKGGAAPTAAPAAAAVSERSDIDELPAQSPRRSAHAVVIGVEHYREKLPAARFASADARLAAEYYKRVLGVPEENVALLTDDRATKSDFEKYFERWLPNRVQKGDEVYVYYSGHGAPNPKNGDAYLVPYDADPTYIDETGYPVKRLYEQLAKLPAKKIVVAMDSCFSGAGGRSVIAKGARPLVSVRTSQVPDGLTVLAASSGDQISNSYEDQGHGLFTYFLLKGLKQKGDDLRAVFDYLKPEVEKVARRDYNADQQPQWMGAR